MIRTTVAELAGKLRVEYVTAAALVKLMVASGGGKEVAKQPAVGGRGKPSVIYELEETYTINLKSENESRAESVVSPVEPAMVQPSSSEVDAA